MTRTPFAEIVAVAAVALAAAACGGSSATPAATKPAPAAAATAGSGSMVNVPAGALPEGVTRAMVQEGDSIFNNVSCLKCHGRNAIGGDYAPTLIKTNWGHGSGSYQDIVNTIVKGVPKDKLQNRLLEYPMNPRGGVRPPLTDDQVRAVAAYVWSLNHR